jgi:hypothetical protein
LIGEALGDPEALRDVSRRCRGYVTEVHDADAVCAKYERLAPRRGFTSGVDMPTP